MHLVKGALAVALAGLELVGTVNVAVAQRTVAATEADRRAASPSEEDGPDLLTRPAGLEVHDVSMAVALTRLAERSEVSVAFSPNALPPARRVTCTCTTVTVAKALDTILAGTAFDYLPLHDQVVIVPGRASPPASRDLLAPVPARVRFAGLRTALPAVRRSVPRQGTVTGRVTEAGTQRPLSSARVQISGTNLASVTNNEGRFQIQDVPEGPAEVTVELLGYITASQSITVAEEVAVTVDFALEPDPLALSELVVVGYGTTSRQTLSHSVSQVTAERLEDRPVSRLDQALQGQMAGVQVRQITGSPGEPLEIRVRGSASISAESDPLYVVDGVPVEDLSRISLNDVESVEVLKDAASSAVYGSRGANGVVLITTKGGSRGQLRFEAHVSYGVQMLEKKLDLLSAEEWIDYALEEINNNWVAYGDQVGQDYKASDPVSFRRQELGVPTEDGRDPETGLFYNGSMIPDPRWTGEAPNNLVYLDWQDEFYSPAAIQRFNIAASGGTDNLAYRLSGNYLNQDGIAHRTSYEQLTLRANFDVDFTETFRMGFMIAPSISWNRGGNVDGKDQEAHHVTSMAPIAEPEARVFTGVGPYQRYSWAGSSPSPVGFQEHATNRVQNGGYFSRLFLAKDIADNLTLRFTGSLNRNEEQSNSYYPTRIQGGNFGQPEGSMSSSSFDTEFRNDYMVESLLSYQAPAGPGHNLGGMLGYTYEHSRERASEQSHSQFPDDLLQTINNNSSTVNESESRSSQHSLISLFGRVTYDYAQKYLATVSLRRDGSSLFGPDNRWGLFPAVSVGWRIGEEPFLQGLTWLDEMKVRFSWGRNGNNSIDNYLYYGSLDRRNYSFGDEVEPAYVPTSISNFDLGWETTLSSNIGLDLDLFGNRLSLTADYYRKTTKDLLLSVPVPTATGFDDQWQNIGQVENEGLELVLTGRHFADRFSVESTVNLSFNRNEVTALGPGGAPIHTGFQGRTEIIQLGKPLGSYYMYDAIGVYMNEEDLANSPHRETNIVGDVKYRDVNGDGEITPDDRTIVGQRNPKYSWGWYNNVRFGRMGISFLVQGAAGNEIMGILGRAIDRPSMGTSTQKLGHWRDRWRSEDDPGNGEVPRLDGTTGGEIDSRWLYDATYTRLKNVTLSYELPEHLLAPFAVNFGRVYISGENLLLFEDYYGGYSPEAENNDGGDYGGYPIARVFNLGVEVNF